MKVLVIIPAYNEQENIIRVIQDIQNNSTNVDYIVINDCSKDNTKKVLLQNGINFVDLPINLGIGGGVQAGYRYALENDYDIAIQFDGDGQHDAKYINNLIAPIENGQANVVIGSRFLEKEGFQSSILRRFGINFLSGLIYFLCGIRVHDVTSGMRAVDKKMIALFAEQYAQDYPEPEAILASGMVGAKIKEVLVQMRERMAGESSISAWKSVYYMIKVSIALIIERTTMRRNKR